MFNLTRLYLTDPVSGELLHETRGVEDVVGDQEPGFGRGRMDPRDTAQDAALVGARSANGQTSSFGHSGNGGSDSESLRSLLRSVKSEAERNAIALALEKTGWNRKAAARLLKVSYRTILYKIDHYHMIPTDSYPLSKPNPLDP